MLEKAPRKVAAKRVAKKVPATAKAIPKKTVRTASAKRAAALATATAAPVRRKAPTPIAAKVQSDRSSRRLLLIGIGIFATCFGLSAFVGSGDAGIIDVRSVIEARKSNASAEERARLERVTNGSIQNSAPDGGLTPSSDQSSDQHSGDTLTATASSSDTTASTTAATSTDQQATSTETELVAEPTTSTE